MRKSLLILAVISSFLSACQKNKSPYDHVDPFIGTGGHGHTFPGATMPFGMVQLSPDTRKDSWDGCSGYHYSDKSILGFSYTHLSGTGVGDYGDFRFMPTVGKLQMNPGSADDPASGYRSRFDHSKESAKPGFYKVKLDDYDIDVELTVTDRAGIQKYIFPETDSAHVIIDLVESITSDKIEFLQVQVLSDQVITGVRRTDGWANDQRIFFYAVFSKPFNDYGIFYEGKERKTNSKVYGTDIKAYVDFSCEKNEEILLKVGISSVSIEGAKLNLLHEIPGWDFDKVKKSARKAWENQLDKIHVKGDNTLKTNFYTALYHSFIAPNLFTDVNGKYRGHDREIHKIKDFDMYTVFSLWDTFRAAHPLFTIVEQDRSNDFVNSMIDIYDKGGLLPVWKLAGNETNCMIGYHSVPVIVDAYFKGIRDYDIRHVYDAMRKSAQQDDFGISYYTKYGYIPADKEGSSISKTLEYAYDDWCIAQMAEDLGREKEYKKYIKRAQNYKNIFDKETGFMRGKRNGTFTEPFDPTEVNFMLTEANTWQYNFFVPQDISGLINLLGGKEKFTEKLDEMFSTSAELSGRHQPDISGMIGQYAHGNEPSHHMAYLYDYAGKPWKTQKIVHRIMLEQYKDSPDGLCGNEDCGQMSAWYVLSAMGFYPVTPGDTVYAIGTPKFEEVRIKLENGNDFKIRAENLSENNYYIQSAKFNGTKYNKCYLSHWDIMRGGELTFIMGDEPNEKWGSIKGDYPVSEISDHLVIPVPYFAAESHAFHNEMQIEIKDILKDVSIYYTTDGSDPTKNAVLYNGPVSINKTTVFNARAYLDGFDPSKISSAEFIKLPANRKIELLTEYSTQYTGGGDIALIDGIRGGNNFRATGWQGYQGENLEAVVDLGKIYKVSSVSVGFLQDQRSWIFMPKKVDVYFSTDGKNFQKTGTIQNSISQKLERPFIKDFELADINRTTRYIKISAKNIMENPDWHKSPGEKSWIFADEIIIN